MKTRREQDSANRDRWIAEQLKDAPPLPWRAVVLILGTNDRRSQSRCRTLSRLVGDQRERALSKLGRLPSIWFHEGDGHCCKFGLKVEVACSYCERRSRVGALKQQGRCDESVVRDGQVQPAREAVALGLNVVEDGPDVPGHTSAREDVSVVAKGLQSSISTLCCFANRFVPSSTLEVVDFSEHDGKHVNHVARPRRGA